MPVFQIRQGATGAILWTGSATSEIQALDAMAHEAGYYDHSDIPDAVRQGGLAVETLSFGTMATTANAAGRIEGGRSGQISERGGFAQRRNEPVAVQR
ncbi:hypothetical protein [Methylobacterium brachythecii]|uniref:Uncharacterized protein n=1 Tax=Methylobacterium brachythecii TaxID=1176177 RepID=A0A7W6F6Y3_9HYPH|nr:hypothetical protein [Methylobacterium brachythecii]MBB3902795.1 hypothetical protein [Methylobacterium brachythecii]GLS43720.1 hypothetical protein GCM10007884_17050 [Methylobacterium brachythecii]